MSEASTGVDTSAEPNTRPDYFQYYICEVAELLSQDEDFLPFSSKTSESVGTASGVVKDKEVVEHDCMVNTSSVSSGSLFSDAAGAVVSDLKKERLKAILRQSVVALIREVDNMLDPVIRMHRLQLERQKGTSASTCEDDAGNCSRKKLKLSSSSSSINIPLHASPASCSLIGEGSGDEHKGLALPGKLVSSGCNNQCVNCQNIDKSKQSTNPEEPKSLCTACIKQGKESCSNKDQNESFWGSNVGDEKENGEVNDDMQILLECDESQFEEMMKKHSAELSATLGHMEQKLEELLDIVMSSCRPMTLAEKHQLWRLINKLPPKNLDRVVEIIGRRKPSVDYSREEIYVDLENEDNVTLWRLYFYVKAVENARLLLG